MLHRGCYQRKLWGSIIHRTVARSIHDSAKSFGLALRAEVAQPLPSKPSVSIDIKSLIHNDLKNITKNIQAMLSSSQPHVTKLAHYYFAKGGKHIRPLIILVMSQATSLVSHHNSPLPDINQPLSSVFSQTGLREKDDFAAHASLPSTEISNPTEDGCIILPSQRRLAEITELIHTASLFHDDVIDMADMRRTQPSVNIRFGSNTAILGGNFLLARASVALARLRNNEATKLMSASLVDLVEGELLQIKSGSLTSFDTYIEKSYLKTASLISNSCKATAILGGASQSIAEHAFNFGKNIGIAFQLTDDRLDFTSTVDTFGKPVGADLTLGLSTAPVLFASIQFPELVPLIERKFSCKGDVQKAHNLVLKSNGLSETLNLAEKYTQLAIDSALLLPPSSSRDALIQLCQQVTKRKN